MRSEPAFDWKFRIGRTVLVSMVLALLSSAGYTTSAQADSFTCKLYLAQSTTMRVSYVKGLVDGYAMALSELEAFAIREKNDPRPVAVTSGLAAAATAMDKSWEPVGKLTVGAVREMLDTECAKSPNKRAVEAFVNFMVRMQ